MISLAFNHYALFSSVFLDTFKNTNLNTLDFCVLNTLDFCMWEFFEPWVEDGFL